MNKNKLCGFTLYLTNDCNLRCSHCWVSGGEKADYLPIESIKKRADEAYSLGVRSFLLTGGEPFIHPNIMDIISYIASKDDVSLHIETNGTIISDEQITVLAKYADIQLSVSVDAATPIIHDKIRGVQGAFDVTIATVEKLVKSNLLAQCIMAVSKLNCNQVEDTILLCISLGVSHIRILPVQPCGRGEDLAKNSISFNVEEQIEFYKRQQELKNKYHNQIVVRTPIPPAFLELSEVKCYQNECSFCNRLTLLPNERYSMCGIGEAHEDYQFGQPGITSVNDCWNKDKRVEQILNYSLTDYKMPCSVCIYKNLCKGFCRAVAIQFPFVEIESYRFCAAAFKKGLFPKKCIINR